MLPNWLYGKSKSKLASILGGGGTPADYDQVKAQVTQNAENITLLSDAVQDSVTWDDLSEVGAVNLFNNTATSNPSLNGLSFIVNDDKSVTISGQNTSSGNTSLSTPDFKFGRSGTFKFTGNTGGSYSTYWLNLYDKTTKENYNVASGKEPIILTIDSTHTYVMNYQIGGNYSISGSVVMKPMISPLDYNGPYVPYAMSNRELTEENKIETGSLTGDVTFSSNEITKKNGIVTINAAFQADKDYNGFTEFVNIPSEFRPVTNRPIGFLFNDTQGTISSVTAFPNGKIQASAAITAAEYYRLVMSYIIA